MIWIKYNFVFSVVWEIVAFVKQMHVFAAFIMWKLNVLRRTARNGPRPTTDPWLENHRGCKLHRKKNQIPIHLLTNSPSVVHFSGWMFLASQIPLRLCLGPGELVSDCLILWIHPSRRSVPELNPQRVKIQFLKQILSHNSHSGSSPMTKPWQFQDTWVKAWRRQGWQWGCLEKSIPGKDSKCKGPEAWTWLRK